MENISHKKGKGNEKGERNLIKGQFYDVLGLTNLTIPYDKFMFFSPNFHQFIGSMLISPTS